MEFFIPGKKSFTPDGVSLAVLSKSFKSSPPKVFCKKGVPEILQNSQENTCFRVYFSIKLQASSSY